jgi:hypothetical protein
MTAWRSLRGILPGPSARYKADGHCHKASNPNDL